MKRLSVLFTALAIIIASASCKADGGVQPSMDNAVIIFFSATGNTERVAQELAAITEAHIAEIEPAEPYSDTDLDYRDDSSRASLENSNPAARPAILPLSEDISGYDTIFLGFPIWFGDMPKIIYTFLDEYDLSGCDIHVMEYREETSLLDALLGLAESLESSKSDAGQYEKLFELMEENGSFTVTYLSDVRK